MSVIRLLDLGTVPAVRSQTCYHAAAEVLTEGGPDTIILVSPASPYVCVGFHQDVDREVDREYCRSRGWPVLRREVGGGAVYLDAGQVFIQWVFRPGSLPASVEDRFRLFVDPIVEAYRALGVAAEFRPVNDIHVAGKKIGGTGAAAIGRVEVVVGSLMFDFDKAAMARVLKVSSEKMRDKIIQNLEQYMTTLHEQLGFRPDRGTMVEAYLRSCAGALGREIVPGSWTEAEEQRARILDKTFLTTEWLEPRRVPRRPGIKIHEDVQVVESVFKAPGGLIRLTATVLRGEIVDLSISGDFTLLPRAAVAELETVLLGPNRNAADIRQAVKAVYDRLRIQSPGVRPEHWEAALAGLLFG
ncbi:MAG: lipoate--protein ligase family protein [Candidatus Aminicenantes bacterium]|nr:lipoate--protein ligase family protein [Candidatus Aminicenantes bacterium]